MSKPRKFISKKARKDRIVCPGTETTIELKMDSPHQGIITLYNGLGKSQEFVGSFNLSREELKGLYMVLSEAE